MSKRKTIKQLQLDVDKAAREAKYYEDQLKIKRREMTSMTRKARTHRLCSHGAILDKFIERPDLLSDDQIRDLLTYAFHNPDVIEKLEQIISEAERQITESP